MIKFFIPYPPSVNNYWGFKGYRRYLTPKAIEFKFAVVKSVLANKVPTFEKNKIELEITLYPPDKRIRDIDNCIKSCLDALCQAKVFFDDSQIDVLIVQRAEIVKGGQALIKIKKLL